MKRDITPNECDNKNSPHTYNAFNFLPIDTEDFQWVQDGKDEGVENNADLINKTKPPKTFYDLAPQIYPGGNISKLDHWENSKEPYVSISLL